MAQRLIRPPRLRLLILGVLCSPGAVIAQSQQAISVPRDTEASEATSTGSKRYEGFFMRLGLGYTSLHSRGRIDAGRIGGPIPKPKAPMGISGDGLSAEFSLGGEIGSRFLLAVDIMSHMFPAVTIEGDPSAWAFVGTDHSMKYTSYGALLVYYPFSNEGFHSGLGISLINSWRDTHRPGFGMSVTPQLGYDVRLDRSWSIGAALRASFSRIVANGRDYQETANVALPTISVIVSYD